MTLHSPASGVVVSKQVIDGSRIKPGSELYRIADLSSIWVVASVYEQDLPSVSLGQEARVNFPHLPGSSYSARVSYIAPYLNERGQVEIRLDVPNDEGLIKPEMYAEVTLQSRYEDRLTIPRSAVINSGARKVVFVAAADDSYEPRVVTTGVIGENEAIEILSGVSVGDDVVIRGQFLLDSESRLSEARGGGHHHGGGTMAAASHDGHDHDEAAESPSKTMYMCSHGCGVARSQPRDCPQCGQPLEAIDLGANEPAPDIEKKTIADGIYTCPMPEHYDIVHFGEGNCDKCGMDLVSLADTDNTGVHVCPMAECGVVQQGPGRCPVCGMNLVPHEQEAGDDG
jgi:hypothetical protein